MRLLKCHGYFGWPSPRYQAIWTKVVFLEISSKTCFLHPLLALFDKVAAGKKTIDSKCPYKVDQTQTVPVNSLFDVAAVHIRPKKLISLALTGLNGNMGGVLFYNIFHFLVIKSERTAYFLSINNYSIYL